MKCKQAGCAGWVVNPFVTMAYAVNRNDCEATSQDIR